MKSLPARIRNRCIDISRYVIKTKCTVRAAAARFNISKSTVYIDITDRIEDIDPLLHSQVKEVLKHNKAVRHLRGGEATKAKFSKKK